MSALLRRSPALGALLVCWALLLSLLSPVGLTAAAARAGVSATEDRGGSLVIKVRGNRFGERVRVVLKGTKGAAKGVHRQVSVKKKRNVRGLPKGKYRVRAKEVSRSGWTASSKPRSRTTRLRGGERIMKFRYRVNSRPSSGSRTSTTPSGTTALRRTWYNRWWWIDLNGDGRWDTAAEDPRGLGTTTNVWSDTNHDGYYDLHWWDATGEGQMDSLQLDPDFNRTMDAYLWDSTGDGQLDRGYSDATGRRVVTLNTRAGLGAAINTTSLNLLFSSHHHCVQMDWCNTGNSSFFPTITPPSLLP